MSDFARKHMLSIGVSVGVLSMMMASPVFAQDAAPAPDSQEEAVNADGNSASANSNDIVVTAQKRGQNIQDVGISITAFSAETIKDSNYANVSDAIAQVPGAIARRHYPSRGLTTNMFIRGIGQTDFNDGTESSIAPFVDDFYLIQASQADFSTYDVERVEVLRGPQGTIFGRNATGGAVQSITAKPKNEFEGLVEVGIGNLGNQTLQGMINIPISEVAQVRFSGLIDRHDHYVKNIFPGNSDQLNQNFGAGRAQLRLTPNDDFEMILKYEYGKVEGNLSSDQGVAFEGTADGDVRQIPQTASGYNPVTDGVDGPNLTNSDSFGYGRNKIQHVLNTIKWDFGSFNLTSITGFLNQKFDIIEDCDGTPNPTCAFWPDVKSKHWSQEIRLNGEAGRLNWTLGGYYLGQRASNHMVLPIFLTPGTATTLPQGFVIDVNWDLDVRSFAAFGQLEYALTDTVTVIGGLRVNNDRKHFEQTRDFVTIQYPAGTTTWSNRELLRFFQGETARVNQHTFTDAVAGNLTTQDDTNFSGTLQVNYKPNSDLLIYGSLRRGLKAAGFNNGLVDVQQAQINLLPYGQEVLHAAELGWKWDFLQDRLGRLNGALFYYDYSGFQATSYVGIGNLISNNDAIVSGGELELQIEPVVGLKLSLGAGFLFDKKVKDVTRVSFTDPTLTFTADRQLGEAPDISLNGALRYEWQSGDAEWGVFVDGNYTGDRFSDVLNQTDLVLPGYATINLGASYKHDTGASVRLNVRNVFDKRVQTNIIAAPGLDNLGHFNYNEPRIYSITVGYKF